MKATQIVAELTALILEHGSDVEVEVRNAAGDLDEARCIWLAEGTRFFSGRVDGDGALFAIIDASENEEEIAERRRHAQ